METQQGEEAAVAVGNPQQAQEKKVAKRTINCFAAKV
jgi:hypothetical protein